MQFDILTIFPDLIYQYCDESIIGRGQKKGLIKIKAHDFRAFSLDKQHHVDDRPYGGGPGMVLQVQPIYACLAALGLLKKTRKQENKKSQISNLKSKIIILDPAGKKFDQRMAEKFSKLDRLVLIAGRYEGFDARVYKLADERISVGDYVLAGGELPALTVVEAVARLIPGVLRNEESLINETHQHINTSTRAGVLRCLSVAVKKEYPQYTRPDNFMGMKVPKVLLSGDHKKIEEWRKKKSK